MPGRTDTRYSWPKLVTGFLNRENNAAPGVPLSSSQFSGGIVEAYPGIVGLPFDLSEDDALKMGDVLNVGTLYGGTYQCVKFRSADAAPKRGQIVYWDQTVAPDVYQVTTNEGIGTGANAWAGIVINPTTTPTSAVITPGNYCFIQTRGRASILFANPLTNPGGAAIGAPAFVAANGSAVADIINTAANPTFASVGLMLARYLGDCETLPVGNAISIVKLTEVGKRF